MTYKTIKNASMRAVNNITLDNIISKRFKHITRGHTDLNIKGDIDLSGLLRVIGGRDDYSLRLRRLIAGGHSWGILERFIYKPKSGWAYCAGQDYIAELNTIRKLLRGV